jgi:3-methylcrotonyl-CoA carboxylase alpha subunit
MRVARLRSGDIVREIRIEKGVAFINGRRVEFERREAAGRLVELTIGGQDHRVVAVGDGDRIWVWCDGVARTFERVLSSRAAASREHGQDLISPMPGRVRRTLVANGEPVTRGQVLLVLEAMKMEHSIRAPKDGSVRLTVREGDLVDAGVELAQIE